MLHIKAVAPAVTDDSSNDFFTANEWLNTTTGSLYECLDDSVGAAVWVNKTEALSGTVVNVAGAIIIGPDAILTPPVIIANQEDYSPVGFVVAGVVKKSFLILTPDSNWAIGGLQPPSPALGNRITILNNSSFNLTLRNNWPISTAEYRFLSGQNIILQAFEAIDFIYSTSLLRWVAITK